MDKVLCNDAELAKNEEEENTSCKPVKDEKSSTELLQVSSNSNCWWSTDNEGGKLDSRQRWSFGSDISIEANENIQNRLCCSPVDEFDSTISSENEDLIVNDADERDEFYKNYIPVSPACSPTFQKVMCSSDNKKCNKNHDVDTADDELIDYSKRYTTDSSTSLVENKHITSSDIRQRQRRNIVVNTVPRHVPEKKSTSVGSRPKVDPFGDYAETDLDQPTDYSLRYAEEDTDDEEKEDNQFYCTGEQEDTVKTYYTEGTPYQTPCNFSNATSMSDLLSLEDVREGDELGYKRHYLRDRRQEVIEKSDKAVKDCKNRMRRKYIAEDSKIPVLEEAREINDQNTCKRNSNKLCTPPQSPAEPCDKDKESKVVTFNAEESYAQETPLMFSRSSSLDSLSEFDQHSIHDDRSSVISDFSHRTSGVVSPSELPDSPTQTVPPSPGRIKQQNYDNQSQRLPLRIPSSMVAIQRPQKIRTMENPPRTHEKVEHHSSVFEDGLVAFKEESMPGKAYSTMASSLSSLTIDDDSEEYDSREIVNRIAAIRVRTSAAGMHHAPTQRQCLADSYSNVDKLPQPNKTLNKQSGCRKNNSVSPVKEDVRYINVESNNSDYMPDYVNKEPQNNRYRELLKDPWYETELKNDNRNRSNRAYSKSPVSKRNNELQKLDADEVIMDTIRIYCTEDTPTYVSPFGSQSNLSALSLLSLSDENFGRSPQFGDDERQYYEDDRNNAYDTDASSDLDSSEDGRSYDDDEEEEDGGRRIDVSPFDSQINIANFSLLRIEEVSEEEDEEEINDETDKSARDDSCAEEHDAYRKLSFEGSDEDRQVFEECINSGISKLTRRRDDSKVDEQRQLF